MNIKMYKNKVDNTFTFKVYRAKKPILLGRSFPSKDACVAGIEQALASIRSNNMINIRSKEGGGGFLFSTNNVESCVFKTLDQASDGLAFLKEVIGKDQDFSVAFDTVKEQVISKKKLGRPSEGYDFKQMSITKQPGFELLDRDSTNFYFHFNDADGKPILFSRSYDGKSARTNAIKKLTSFIETDTLVTKILAAGNSSVFLLKTADQIEIGRSKRFKSKAAAIAALEAFKKEATGKMKDLKLSKKKKKKKKKKLPKDKYDLEAVAPIGNIGFEAFRNKENKCHYFQFFDKKAKPLLYSRAFASRSKRDMAISESIELSKDKRLYAITEKEGNYHFILQTADGKGLAKSRIFPNKKSLIEGLRYFHSNAKSYADVSNVLMVSSSEQIPLDISKKKPTASKKVKTTAAKPIAAKEVPTSKTNSKIESNSNSKRETPKKTAPEQQQGASTNRRKNTASTPAQPVPSTDKKQAPKQAPKQAATPSRKAQQKATQSNPQKSTPQNSQKGKGPNVQKGGQKSGQTKPPKRTPQQTSQEKPSNTKAPRSTASNNRNRNSRNRNHPPLKEGEYAKQSSTRTNYATPIVSKPSTDKDAPPRILPRGETEIPQLGIWKWLIPLIFAALVGLFLLRACGGTTEETTSATPIIEKTKESVVEKLPTLLGVNAADLGFKKGMVAAKIADFLSAPTSVFPATFVLDKVHFPTNQDLLDREAYAQLDRMALILAAYPNAVVQIKGHTDNVGGPERNLELSQERAAIVLNYLLKKGIPATQISAKGFGETEPIQTNDTEAGRFANRRSEIVLIKR